MNPEVLGFKPVPANNSYWAPYGFIWAKWAWADPCFEHGLQVGLICGSPPSFTWVYNWVLSGCHVSNFIFDPSGPHLFLPI